MGPRSQGVEVPGSGVLVPLLPHAKKEVPEHFKHVVEYLPK